MNKNSAAVAVPQSNPLIDLNSLFDNNLMALALIDQNGLFIQMNGLFSKITGISVGLANQNILNYSLFNHPSFISHLADIREGKASEFALNRFVDSGYGKRKYIQIKAFKTTRKDVNSHILISLEETTDHVSIEEVIQKIGDGLEKSTDEYFFDSMCLNMSESLGIGMVFIGEFDKEENVIHSISFWTRDRFVPEMSYPLKGTPTEAVMRKSTIKVYEEHIQRDFPNDPSLKYWGVNSYIGCPLVDSQGEMVGYISVMDSQPIRNMALAQSVLRIYSHSLGRELERMTQQQKIKSGEKRFKLIHDKSPFGIVVSTKGGKLLCNPRFSQMLGYSEEELSKLTRLDITHPDDLDVHIGPLGGRDFKDLEQITFRKRYIRKNSDICYAKVTVSYIEEEAGNPESFVLVEDITDKLANKKKLQDNQKLIQSIIETAQDAVITFNHNDLVIEWNNRAVEMFGYTKVEAKKMCFNQFLEMEIVDEKKHNTLKEFVKAFKCDENIERMEVKAKAKDGRIFPAELSLSPIKVDDGYVYSTFISDITTYKQYQDILNQNLQELNEKNVQLRKYIDSNMQLENFAHIASHDLKEPLRSIGNFSQLLNKRLQDKLDETEREFFNFILTGVQNMNKLIEDLLMYSSVNSHNATTRELNLNDVLFIVSRNLDKAIQETNTELIINELPAAFVSCDTKMKQLFQNLIANAIKFRKVDVKPKITVSCEDAVEFWKFKIQDNGIGIKEEFKEKIFMIFKKLHAKTEYQGTGIGLAVCKKVVDQHGGEIWIESTYGEGTTFYFTLMKNDRSIL